MSELPPSEKYPNPETAFFYEDFEVLGYSAGEKKITGKKWLPATAKKKALLIGGVHGNETEGVMFMEAFCREFIIPHSFPFPVGLYVIPCLNPDGFFAYERGNKNGVDLNRNLPTKDWTPEYKEKKYYPGEEPGSEPENKILIRILNEFQPDFILSFHSWKPMINTNGPAENFAKAIYEKLPMEISDDIGYPTPGSLGTYAGWERNIPTITLEFARGTKLKDIYPQSRDAILNALSLLQA